MGFAWERVTEVYQNCSHNARIEVIPGQAPFTGHSSVELEDHLCLTPALISLDFMDINNPIEVIHDVRKRLWIERVNQARVAGHMTSWMSSLHPKKLGCRLDCKALNGSYNLCQRLRFCDGTTWLLRMPIVGSVCDEYADEKVAMEVEALSLLRDKNVPVPGVIAWGLTAANPLGLGPYVVMDFVEGASVNTLLREQQHDTRWLRDDICDDDVEFLSRQFARILLHIFQIDFPTLGSLPTPVTVFNAPVRPLTFKAHDILQTGGVNTFGDRTKGFADTADYFCHLVNQDWEQFQRQPNSGGGPTVTQAKYAAFLALHSSVTIPASLTLSFGAQTTSLWSGSWTSNGRTPARRSSLAPWWLLQDRLNNYDTFLNKEEAPRFLGRYLRNLDVFKTVLDEEEARTPGQQTMELSRLGRHSEKSGSMWLHMLLSWGFNHPDSLPFAQLQVRLERERWKELEEGHHGKEAREFTERKLAELDKYDETVERIVCMQDDLENGKMTIEAFVAVLKVV
ncbi:uncharacterized protein PV06_08392 [Exophiala oligosperma]|uniref:Aminoglycoside phosphotransferase domain-containing protein n=1 Tax=Exophiala oligosperma TaxID=215243 RepID=A0A0D2D9L8_9EURO|nr:uncharacterized protein PV06_08392 [Exophiala oligosperma]KIW39808.1 hypothetical protein PV06_08392 [Exophiala oligosperma]